MPASDLIRKLPKNWKKYTSRPKGWDSRKELLTLMHDLRENGMYISIHCKITPRRIRPLSGFRRLQAMIYLVQDNPDIHYNIKVQI